MSVTEGNDAFYMLSAFLNLVIFQCLDFIHVLLPSFVDHFSNLFIENTVLGFPGGHHLQPVLSALPGETFRFFMSLSNTDFITFTSVLYTPATYLVFLGFPLTCLRMSLGLRE